MDELITPLLIVTGALRQRLDRVRRGLSNGVDAGMGTLELVIITLGLIAVAALLVAAITAAVTSRTEKIK